MAEHITGFDKKLLEPTSSQSFPPLPLEFYATPCKILRKSSPLCLSNYKLSNTYNIQPERKSVVKRENTKKIQQSGVYYQLLSQHVSGIIMPIFGRAKTACYCIWCTALVLLDVVGSGFGGLHDVFESN